MSIYTDQGYDNRADYLKQLCKEYPERTVMALADLYGPSEDFDGLIVSLEDTGDNGWYEDN